jgi:hypothetical protein
MSNRRHFLSQSAAAAFAVTVAPFAHALSVSDDATRAPITYPITWRQYLENSTVPRSVIDQFLKEPGCWAKFDPEVGYILGDSLQHDGIDGCWTTSTARTNGTRTSFLYVDRKPRINTYGDSFTQCVQVSDGETWQEDLAAHLGEPIRNFGVGGFGDYQAYRRMIREENTDDLGAEYVIFYIWGDDPIRSLLRARWADIYPWFRAYLHSSGISVFQGNFWSNLEIDLESGQFVEKAQLLPTKESLYHMTDAQWMVDHLEDDLALQLSAYSRGRITDLDRYKISRLASHLGFDFDWNLSTERKSQSVSPGGGSELSPMQSQTGALLDRYSLRGTRYILERVKAFTTQNSKKLMVILFDPYRAMVELRDHGKRYDQETVDYLKQEGFNYFDMNLVQLADFKNFNLSWNDYMKRYFIGHYNPAGNHFFAFSIMDKIVQWLDPKPIPYQQLDQQSLSFKGYLKGYK